MPLKRNIELQKYPIRRAAHKQGTNLGTPNSQRVCLGRPPSIKSESLIEVKVVDFCEPKKILIIVIILSTFQYPFYIANFFRIDEGSTIHRLIHITITIQINTDFDPGEKKVLPKKNFERVFLKKALSLFFTMILVERQLPSFSSANKILSSLPVQQCLLN